MTKTDVRYIIELTGTRKSEYKGLNYIERVTYGEVIFEIHPTTDRDKALQYEDAAEVIDLTQSLILNGHKAKIITLEAKRITARDVNKVLKEKGFKERLMQGRGYCYFVDGKAHEWFSSSVPVCYVNDYTIAQWLEERETLSKS